MFRRFAIIGGLGIAFAGIMEFTVFAFDLRYALTAAAGIVIISCGMVSIHRGHDLPLYLLTFNLPFTSIEKSFFLSADATYVTPGFAVGLMELLLLILYGMWFFRIVVTRQDVLPRLTGIDWAVLFFLFVHLISLYDSASRELTVFEIIRLAKYAAAFFYLEHKLERRHLRTVILAILMGVVLQTSLGAVQHRTGKLLGIGRTKGSSELNYEQYTVKNFESYYRSEGTTFDSHALGLYLAMSLPLGAALAVSPRMRIRSRVLVGGMVLVGLGGLAMTFARAGWSAFGAALLVLLISELRWKRGRSVLIGVVVLLVVAVPVLLPFKGMIKQRLFEAPPELVTGRIETIEIAWDIWKQHLLVGCGANTYMRELEIKKNILEGDPYFIPPHNMFVLIGTEMGVLGLAAFLVLSVAVVRLNWQVIKARSDYLGALAAGVLAAFVAFQVEGIFDPIYVTNVTYFLLWFVLGLGAALWRMTFLEPSSSPAQDRQLLPVVSGGPFTSRMTHSESLP
jgi:putative inorganic carbon (hco3(-)) transporter